MLAIHLTPWAKTERVEQQTDMFGALTYKVRVTARPIDGQANEALIDLIVRDPKAFDIETRIRRNQVTIVSWHTSRHKIISLALS